MTEILAAEDAVGTWSEAHDHDLHTIEAMTQAVATTFTLADTSSVPYLYRYLVPVLPETPRATDFLRSVFKEEARLGARGEIVLIGRRIVASR